MHIFIYFHITFHTRHTRIKKTKKKKNTYGHKIQNAFGDNNSCVCIHRYIIDP